jgi:DNA-binding response OmpR family regulator
MKLLVVDDNEEITEVISYYCESQKIDCKIINDGKEGLDAIRKGDFNLILLDLAMPYFSGIDVINSLKTDGLLEEKNIAVFTASSDHRLYDELKRSGIKEIFKKPCSVDDLTELINKYDKTV